MKTLEKTNKLASIVILLTSPIFFGCFYHTSSDWFLSGKLTCVLGLATYAICFGIYVIADCIETEKQMKETVRFEDISYWELRAKREEKERLQKEAEEKGKKKEKEFLRKFTPLVTPIFGMEVHFNVLYLFLKIPMDDARTWVCFIGMMIFLTTSLLCSKALWKE